MSDSIAENPMAPAERYDVLAFGAHPDDLQAVMGGTTVKLVRQGLSVLYVDLCDGEPARHAPRGERNKQAVKAAEILGVHRTALALQDRLIEDTLRARLQVALLLRKHRPRIVFTTSGAGVHPDHSAVTNIVTNGVFYARLPKWDEIAEGELLKDTEPHEIDRLFYGHCRMEPAWERFDFAVDVSPVYDIKLAALRAYEAVFSGDQASLLDKYDAEDRYVGSLVNVRYAEAFRSRSPLLISTHISLPLRVRGVRSVVWRERNQNRRYTCPLHTSTFRSDPIELAHVNALPVKSTNG